MRVLILTDTHGHLHLINKLAHKHSAQAVLHCGDFGFYSEARLEELPDRELALRIRHSEKLRHLKNKAFSMSRPEKIEVVRTHHLEGEFELYLQGKAHFDVPVYCVPGNHEDGLLVKQLTEGAIKIPNLHLLTETSDVVLGQGKGRVRLVGIGGNFIHFTFFDREGSDAFYPSMRFTQWVRLLQRFAPPPPALDEPKAKAADAVPPAKGKGKGKGKAAQGAAKQAEPAADSPPTPAEDPIPTWLLTHVSPGKLPSLELLGLYVKPQMWFSGHMGPHLPNHYALFTFCDDYEFAHRTRPDVGFLLQQHARLARFWNLWYACHDLLSTAGDGVGEDDDVAMPVMASLERYEAELAAFHPPKLNEDEGDDESEEKTKEKSESEENEKEEEKEKEKEEKKTVREMVLEIVRQQPVPGLLKSYVLAAADERQMADRARAVFFIAPHISREKRGKVFVPMQGYESPNPRQIPSRDEIRLIEAGLPYLRVPFPVPDDAMHVDNRAKRVPSDWVKSTMFFNLPDAYIGGYMYIDVDEATGRMDTAMLGSFPPRSIVDDADDPWLAHDAASSSSS